MFVVFDFCHQVRQVEYKNKMDEEWELFTRAMKEQNVVGNRISILPQLRLSQFIFK